MGGIRVRVTNEVGVATHRVELPHDVPVGKLLKVLPARLSRTALYEDGSPIGYRLYANNAELNQDQTLAQANVHDGDTISLRAEATAGGGNVGCGGELNLQVEPLPPQIVAPVSIGAPRVCCGTVQMERMIRHVCLYPEQEAGGILLGRADVNVGFVNLTVLSSLPAEAVRSGPAHLTFTQETWRLLNARRAAECPQMLVLGWYHSHPGLGVFLSGFDRQLHRQVFGHEPWSVALVIDPLAGTRAFFWSLHGRVMQCPERASEVPSPTDVHGGGSQCPT